MQHDIKRGDHAYCNTEQVLICVSLKIKCFNGNKEIIYKLNNPDEAIYQKSRANYI